MRSTIRYLMQLPVSRLELLLVARELRFGAIWVRLGEPLTARDITILVGLR